MFRDFHLIRGQEDDVLFFPGSYRLIRIAKSEGDGVADYLAGRGDLPPSAPVAEAIAIESTKAKVAGTFKPWGDTDSLCLVVAHDCNLHCTYCYNNRGRVVQPGRMMEPKVAEAALRRFFVTPGKRYAVAFYGGEPLLNFRAIKAIVGIGRELEAERDINIAFSITTNGTLFNRAMEDFLCEHFFSITVSLDGPKEIHDHHRRCQKGGSYDRVLATIERLKVKGGPRLTLKGTLAREGVKHYIDSLEHLRKIGTHGASLTPVELSGGSSADLSDADYENFVAQRVALNSAALDAGFSGDGILPDEALTVVANLLTHRKLRRHCNAGRDLALTADGSLYACHGFVGNTDYFMGKVDELDSDDFHRVRKIFAGLDVDQIAACAACWARYFCGGACYTQSHFSAGDVTRPDFRHCLLTKRCAETVIRGFVGMVAQEDRRTKLYVNMRKIIGAADAVTDVAHA